MTPASSASLSAPRLTPTSYAVLGIVALRGPSTPYQIKRALGRLGTHFWSVPHTQCYTETQRLAAAGLLSVDYEAQGRRRQSYGLTETGQSLLRDWLGEPTAASMEIRDVAELKLFCGEFGRPEDIVALARQQVVSYRRRLASLDEVERRFAERGDLALRMAPTRLGRRVYQVAVDFWQEIAEHPPLMQTVATDE
jgi:PadR family transcriptional regulator, regulatory protein AphA